MMAAMSSDADLNAEAANAAVTAAVASWAEVSTHAHRFGGVEFRLGRRELGHLHARIADVPLPRRIRDEVIAAGRGRPHHVLPESGWVTVPITTGAEVDNAIGVFELSYERALAARRSSAVRR
jgi:luciferase-like monooxygenase